MELYYEEEKQTKKKSKAPIFIGIFIILLVLLTTIIFYAIMYIKTSILKVKINGVSQNDFGKLVQMTTTSDNKTEMYFPIRKIAKYFGYSDYAGDYSTKSEDSTKCYVDNGEEIALFTVSSNTIIISRDGFPIEQVEIDKKVVEKDGELYTTEDGIEKAFNIIFEYAEDTKTINIYTLDYLVTAYLQQYKLDEKNGPETISDKKAILEGLLIYQTDDSNKKYGVMNVSTGKNVLEAKYDLISYFPYSSQFLVESNGKYGMTDASGKIKLKVAYDEIKICDNELGLYLVKENNLYGIVKTTGDVLLSSSFQQIGVDSNSFKENRLENQYILVNELIPVKYNNMWGFYNTKGERITDFSFVDVGCKESKVTNTYPVVEIPSLNLIVVKTDKTSYNLINRKGTIKIGAPLNTVYLKTDASTGKNTYYMTYGGTSDITKDIEEFFASMGVSE